MSSASTEKARDKAISGIPEHSRYSESVVSDLLKLVLLHTIWKAILLIAVCSSPGLGYDSSTKFLFDDQRQAPTSGLESILLNIALRLTRWDGVYFTSMSAHGLIYEQQWAFSWAFTRLIAFFNNVIPLPSSLSPLIRCSLIASIVSHFSHCGFVILFFLFIMKILPAYQSRKRQIAFSAACLQIISPAGVFLIGPYSESTFAFLGMLGSLAHAHAISSRMNNESTTEHVISITAGLVLGLATMVRSNGLLYGLIFAWDALNNSLSMFFESRSTARLLRLCSTLVAGSLVGLGFVLPQFIAYRQYCIAEHARPWCTRMPPSIYSWVQSHYWNVGFFRYWTLSNAPLFLLASPMLFLLLNTGYAALHHIRSILIASHGEETPKMLSDGNYQRDRLVFAHVMERHGLIQIVLALLALTSFHVQIINRISTPYPVWSLLIAISIHDQSPQLGCGHALSEHYYPFRWLKGQFLKWVVRGFVIYSIVQAGLYSAFLPPA